MSDSVQDVYAKNLPTEFGYPLRTPEPSNTLPESYQNDGLQIGDVGYVDSNGRFQVLFNIRYSPDHDLHRKHRIPPDFEPIECGDEELDINPNAIPSDHFISSPHIRHQLPAEPDERVIYRFVPSSPSGAILVLPFGAVRHELKEKEEFHKIAIKNAQRWCAFARRNSLYLITGLHKTHSWSLGSFHNAPHDGEILVKRPNEEDVGARIHKWEPTFSMYWRAGPRNTNNGSLNQTVFISGFKVMVRWWLPGPVIELLPRASGIWVAMFHMFMSIALGILYTLWNSVSLKGYEHVPRLSQPFHPSDVINRFLLDMNPDADVAVTHDSQWMHMLEMEGLAPDDMRKESFVRKLLTERYVLVADDNAVYLQRRKDTTKPEESLEVFAVSSPSNSDATITICGNSNKPQARLQVFSLPAPSIGNPWIVISRIRVDNINESLICLPVGFYVLVQFNAIQRKTKVRSLSVCESVLEWDDEIILSYDPSVRVKLSFCAAFELEEVLGNGKAFSTVDITVGDLVGNTSLINFPRGDGKYDFSLLLAVERRHYPYSEAYLNQKHDSGLEISFVAQETDLGHDALFRYLEHYGTVDLGNAIKHFERALHSCPPDHECRASALLNLATAKLHRCKVSGTAAGIPHPIALYREALEMRRAPHPDRPATLLSLGQALLYRYQRRGHKISLADDVEELMKEVKVACPEGSRERRAAILVLQGSKRTRVISQGTLPELDGLIVELGIAVRVPPGDHFDRPYRLENLGLALRRRFELQGEHGQARDLDQSIVNLEDAIQLLHERHPDRARQLHNLGFALYIRFVKLGNLDDLERAIASKEEAVPLLHECHSDRARQLQNLGSVLYTRFVRLGNLDDLERVVAMEEEAVRLTPKDHPARAQRLKNLGTSLRARFARLGDLTNIEQSIAWHSEATQLTPDDDPHHPGRLESLGSSLRARFHELGNIKDLGEAVARREKAEQLTPKDSPDRARRLQNLGSTLCVRFIQLGDTDDLERAIAMGEEAVRLTPEDHPARAQRLKNLGTSLRARYVQLEDPKDIERSIARHNEAIRLTPDDDPRRPDRLESLGRSLLARFRKCGHIKDLEEAIARQEQANQLTPRNSRDRTRRLQNHARALRTCSARLGNHGLPAERPPVKDKDHEDVVRHTTPHQHIHSQLSTSALVGYPEPLAQPPPALPRPRLEASGYDADDEGARKKSSPRIAKANTAASSRANRLMVTAPQTDSKDTKGDLKARAAHALEEVVEGIGSAGAVSRWVSKRLANSLREKESVVMKVAAEKDSSPAELPPAIGAQVKTNRRGPLRTVVSKNSDSPQSTDTTARTSDSDLEEVP